MVFFFGKYAAYCAHVIYSYLLALIFFGQLFVLVLAKVPSQEIQFKAKNSNLVVDQKAYSKAVYMNELLCKI